MRVARIAIALLLLSYGCAGGETTEISDEVVPERPEVQFWRAFRGAKQAEREGDAAAAITMYERALQLDPDHGDTLYYLSQVRYKRGEVTAAHDHLEHLAELEPRALRPWQQLSALRGQPAAGMGPDLQGALAAAGRALELNPAESKTHLLLARWAAYQGDRDAALASLDTALGHNPRLWQAYLLQLWLQPAAAVAIRAQVVDQLCDGEEGRAPQCASHAALHVALARVGDAGTALIAAANPAVGAGGAAAEVVGAEVLARYSAEARARIAMRRASWPTEPWRAAVVDSPAERGVVVLEGGARAPTYFDFARRDPQSQALPEFPEVLSGTALAAADFDNDGIDDLFVANVAVGPAGSNRIGGALFRGLGGGRFEPTNQTIRGPLLAAVAADLDGDAMPDLLVARAPDADAMASYLAAPTESATVAAAAGAEPGTGSKAAVELWRNRGGLLELDAQDLPDSSYRVQDLAVGDFDGDGAADVYFATGSLAPEYTEPDRLWLWRDGRFVDASHRLGATRFGSSLRVWSGSAGDLLVLRGGLVPGDPQRLLLFAVGHGEEAAEK